MHHFLSRMGIHFMLVNCFKIFHILSAAALVTSVTYSIYIWKNHFSNNIERIQIQTNFIIIPLAILQLLTGFSMMNLNHENFSQLWIKASILSFIVAIGSWLGFNYFLANVKSQNSQKYLNPLFLIICTVAFLSMIFFMSNKIA